MIAKINVLGDMIDDDGTSGLANFATDGAPHIQFTARAYTEIDVVANRAGNPAVFGDPGNGGKAHAG